MSDISITKNKDPKLAAEIYQRAQKYREMMRELSGQDLAFTEDGVQFLHEWIEHVKKDPTDEEFKLQVAEMAGAFFGECIRHEYGGQWQRLDDGNVMLAFHLDRPDPLSAVNVMPFNKVMNQFENKNNLGTVLDMYASVARQRRKISATPGRSDPSSLKELTLDAIEQGKKLVRVSFAPSTQKADGKVLYATTLTSRP